MAGSNLTKKAKVGEDKSRKTTQNKISLKPSRPQGSSNSVEWHYLVGGGSGGHVVPNKVVAEELLRRDPKTRIVVLVNNGYFKQTLKIYEDLLSTHPDNIVIVAIRSGKFRRFGLGFLKEIRMIRIQLLNFRDLFYSIAGFIESKIILRRYPPAVIFCKGGSASLEFCLAAKGRAPIVVHDSDTRPGVANKTVAKWAQRVLTGLDQDTDTIPKKVETGQGRDVGIVEIDEADDDLFYDNKSKVQQQSGFSQKTKEVVGIPIDESFKQVTRAEKLELKEFLGFKKTSKVVLILGGSLGAQKINQIIFKILPALNTLGVTVLHQVGNREDDFKKARHLRAKLTKVGLNSELYQPFKFSYNLPELYAASDMVIARAGATTIQELANTATPAILIPANLTDQKLNIKLLESQEAVLSADQTELLKSPQKLAAQVELTLSDRNALKDLSKNISGFAQPDSAKVIVDILQQEQNS